MDKINGVSQFIMDGLTITRYEVYYEFGDYNVKPVVIVESSEMTNVNDLDELKTLANVKASELKSGFPVPTFSVNQLTDLDGEVTL
jgi:hypothetical protein